MIDATGFTAADEPLEIRQVRSMSQDDVRCDAGEYVHGSHGDAVVCHIERVRIDGVKNPDSIQAFCLGDPTRCPTWRAERDRITAHDKTELVDRRPRDYSDVRARIEARKARTERARELMLSDTDEGKRYRAHLARIMDPARNPFVRQRVPSAAERAAAMAELAATAPTKVIAGGR